jgi:hypothetical protein
MLLKSLRGERRHGIKGPVSQTAGASHDAPSSTWCPREAGAHPYLPSGRRHDLCIAGFQFDDVVKEPVVPTQSGRRRRPANVGLERFLDEFL